MALADMIEQLDNQNEQLQQENQKLKQQVSTLRQQLQSISSTVKQNAALMNSNVEKQKDLQSKEEKLNSRSRKLNEKEEKLNNKEKQLTQEAYTSKQNYDDAQSKLREAEQTLADAESERQRRLDEVKDWQDVHAQAERRAENLAALKEGRRKDLQTDAENFFKIVKHSNTALKIVIALLIVLLIVQQYRKNDTITIWLAWSAKQVWSGIRWLANQHMQFCLMIATQPWPYHLNNITALIVVLLPYGLLVDYAIKVIYIFAECGGNFSWWTWNPFKLEG